MTSNWEPGGDTAGMRCWAELDEEALLANAAALRSQAGGAGIMAVVKANAYGHGLAGVVQALAGRVEMFGVANLMEARMAREALRDLPDSAPNAPETPIFILGSALPAERAAIVAERFIAAVSSTEEAAAYAACGRARLHLAIDTGMGRMGAWEPDAGAIANAIRKLPNVELAGIWSHLPVADEDDDFTRAQLERFHRLAEKIAEGCSPAPLIHVANSAGAIAFPRRGAGLVRAGLALYGVSPRPEFQAKLRPVLTWKTRVVLARNFPVGHGVSYGRAFITDRPMRIATLAVGYADGYQRQVSGRGAQVLIRGRRCAVLGRVTMDQIMVDVTALPDVAGGEEVVLIGRQHEEEITAAEFAKWAGTIPWHVFTGMGTRVIRVRAGKSAPFQMQNPQ
jgi:alanine racemase